MAFTRTVMSSVLLLTVLLASGTDGVRAADPVKLTGCVIKSDDGDGYLLVNMPATPAAASTASATVTPGAVGTTGSYANVFYWLANDDDLKPHIGHQVEIEGELKGDIKDGELKVERKDQWTEIEIKSDGRGMTAKVPNASVIAPRDSKAKLDVLVKRVDTEKVRMLAASCQ